MSKERCRKIWLNEAIVPIEDAKVNALSPTAQFGANVFEGIRCYWNEEHRQLYAFRLDDHYKRLRESMRLFRMECNYSVEYLKESLIEAVKANDYREDIQVRQTVFVDGQGSWFSLEPVGMFVAPIPKSRKSVPISGGERTLISSWQRISDRVMSPRAKVGANYINSRLAKLEAMDKGFDSALFLNDQGYISEGTGACFFIVRDGILITPELTDSILQSITRDTIIRIAKEVLSIPVEIRHINRTEVYLAQEAFFCGSAAEITPVVQIDSYILGAGVPGELTSLIHKRYIETVSNKNSDFREWLTPIY